MKRIFLAIRIPNEISDEIEKFKKGLERILDAKFVEKENFHYNLKFFGLRTDFEIKKIKEAVRNAIKRIGKFEIEIRGVGFFPDERKPRVVWLGVGEGKEKMIKLFLLLEEEFQKIKIEKEIRKFVPHLTICRLKSSRNKEILLKKAKRNKTFGKFEVSEINLIESKLSPKGPKYIDLEKFSLE